MIYTQFYQIALMMFQANSSLYFQRYLKTDFILIIHLDID